MDLEDLRINAEKWINSEEYLINIDVTRTRIVKYALESPNEATTASIFENELYYLIKFKTGIVPFYSKEISVSSVEHKFGSLQNRKTDKGKLDAVVNNLIIEYKHHSKLQTKRQFEIAANQVIDYLQAIYRSVKKKTSAILTDGIKISYFDFVGSNVKFSILTPISNEDIDCIIRAILFNDSKRFVPENIVNDFSIYANTKSITKDIAQVLYNSLKCPIEKTNMLYEEWKGLMHLSVEDKGKSNDIKKRREDLSMIFSDTISNTESEYQSLYALQTTYSIIVKLIACKVIDRLEYSDNTNYYYDLMNVSSSELQNFFEMMEDGYSYKSKNIVNFLEGDYFSWYADKEQWTTKIYEVVLKAIKTIAQYSDFNFNIVYQPIDIFKDLYMSIIPKSIRHSMGEYFTPEWLADHVVSESLKSIKNVNWKGIDPCCGSGIFIISMIKHIVGDRNIQALSMEEREELRTNILNRVFGVDINPLSVLSARVGYYLALRPLGDMSNLEIPVYLGDSAIIPLKVEIGNIKCFQYSINNKKIPFDIVLPERLVGMKNFTKIMNQLQTYVKTDDENILYTVIISNLSKEEKESEELLHYLHNLAHNLVLLHKNGWDSIWIRICTNYMLIARLSNFDLITGNPPWVKWEHLPSMYASKIKELCNIKHIFSNDGQFGGTQLNICALISNVTASNWLNSNGILAFLMPDSIMSQNSYEGFRDFYIDYEKKRRLYLQKIDKWEAPLRPFRCDEKPITQDFNTYYFSNSKVNYSAGINVNIISRQKNISDIELNKYTHFSQVEPYLILKQGKAAQLSDKTTAFSYISNTYDFSKIIGKTNYRYRTGVEFTPQELYMLIGAGQSSKGNYLFKNKKFKLSKYIISDMPSNGWDLPTKYIYPIVTGPNISPFKYEFCNEYCILPYDTNDTSKAIDMTQMLTQNEELFDYLVKHKNLIDQQSEKSKIMHRGTEFYALSKIGTYTFADNIVAVRDNTHFCASVINKTETAWGELKHTICVKHTIIISQDISGRNISSDEAYYLCGILNSDIITNYMHSSFKTNGFSLNKSNIYLPLYDSKNSLHKKISMLSRQATQNKNVNKITKEITDLYLLICEDKCL